MIYLLWNSEVTSNFHLLRFTKVWFDVGVNYAKIYNLKNGLIRTNKAINNCETSNKFDFWPEDLIYCGFYLNFIVHVKFMIENTSVIVVVHVYIFYNHCQSLNDCYHDIKIGPFHYESLGSWSVYVYIKSFWTSHMYSAWH